MVSELSILIPVYNRSVRALVQRLAEQAKIYSISVEIRIYDDGSAQAFKELNQELLTFPEVIYKELPANVGRSQIRHLLAQDAKYKTLLFLDNDVLPVNQNFLEAYCHQHQGHVTVGGICYQQHQPAPELRLRWLYGRNREQASAIERQKSPYERVFLSNLMIDKELFLKYFQKEMVITYGHEDTLFADQLRQYQIPVLHIENPAEHLGIDDALTFLEKTNSGLQNLVHLSRLGKVPKDSKLLWFHQKLKYVGLMQVISANSKWLLPTLKRHLTSANPTLRAFDLYKLLMLDQYMSKKQ